MKCPTCGVENESNAAFCDQCGATLGSAAPMPSGGTAQATPPQPQITPPPPAPPLQPRAQPASSVPPANIPPVPSVPPVQPSIPPPPESVAMPVVPCHLMIGGQSVPAPLKKQVVLGRADAATSWMPDVDLAPYGGTYEAGVSRTHAQFVWQGMWALEDLNSTNGTFLRGQRLFPGTRTPINNGEIFQIGKLEIRFFTQ